MNKYLQTLLSGILLSISGAYGMHGNALTTAVISGNIQQVCHLLAQNIDPSERDYMVSHEMCAINENNNNYQMIKSLIEQRYLETPAVPEQHPNSPIDIVIHVEKMTQGPPKRRRIGS